MGLTDFKMIFYTNSSKKKHKTVDTNQIPLGQCPHEKKIAVFFLVKIRLFGYSCPPWRPSLRSLARSLAHFAYSLARGKVNF